MLSRLTLQTFTPKVLKSEEVFLVLAKTLGLVFDLLLTIIVLVGCIFTEIIMGLIHLTRLGCLNYKKLTMRDNKYHTILHVMLSIETINRVHCYETFYDHYLQVYLISRSVHLAP